MRGNVCIVLFILIVLNVFLLQAFHFHRNNKKKLSLIETKLSHIKDSTPWQGSNPTQIPTSGKEADLIQYGYQLVVNTNYYFGKNGIVKHNNNDITCQSCHLEAGTKPFGNNFGKVFATYPQFRARNNGTQTIYMRLNDCFQRSMNGQALDSNSREMKALEAYIVWLGKDCGKGEKKTGTSIPKLAFLNRAADPRKGEQLYIANCSSCHGKNGEGQYNIGDQKYTYPPLWGSDSWNDGAGMYRIGTLSSFIHYNMPQGTTYDRPTIGNEDCWDIAAYVLSKPRPHFDNIHDFQNLNKKPIDNAFGPYLDDFPEQQHKYGPFEPIQQFYQNIKN
ncbi:MULTISPECIES: c-type cytochrome [Chitinophagaceae]